MEVVGDGPGGGAEAPREEEEGEESFQRGGLAGRGAGSVGRTLKVRLGAVMGAPHRWSTDGAPGTARLAQETPLRGAARRAFCSVIVGRRPRLRLAGRFARRVRGPLPRG